MNLIDINCDLGELDGEAGRQLDESILPWVSSVNVACGAHAGSESRMRELAILCRQHGVAFGAHPGFCDREGFGRRAMNLSEVELYDLVCDQIGLAIAICHSEGIPLAHVKPHGALYNLAAIDQGIASVVASAVRDKCPSAKLVGLSGSRLILAGNAVGLSTLSEVFADRNYSENGILVPRQHPDAVLHDPDLIALRALRIIQTRSVFAVDGSSIALLPETLCVHSDTVNAVHIARTLWQQLRSEAWSSQQSHGKN